MSLKRVVEDCPVYFNTKEKAALQANKPIHLPAALVFHLQGVFQTDTRSLKRSSPTSGLVFNRRCSPFDLPERLLGATGAFWRLK